MTWTQTRWAVGRLHLLHTIVLWVFLQFTSSVSFTLSRYLFSSALLHPCNFSGVSMAITREQRDQTDWGWVVDAEKERGVLYYTFLNWNALVCILICNMCSTLFCVFVFAHKSHTADKALIGWSRIHHGNNAMSLALKHPHRERVEVKSVIQSGFRTAEHPDSCLQRIGYSLTVVCTDSLRARGQ